MDRAASIEDMRDCVLTFKLFALAFLKAGMEAETTIEIIMITIKISIKVNPFFEKNIFNY